MKRIILKSLTVLLLGSALLISCESNNVVKVSEIKSKSEMSSGEKVVNYILGTGKFIECDESNFYTTTVFGSVKQQTGSVLVNKKARMAGFGSPYMAAYYVTQFNDESRHTFADAVESYLEDFENKNLDRKDSSSVKKYGKGSIRVDWGTIKATTPNYGSGFCVFGYKFKNKSPYFTITVYPVDNKLKETEEVGEANSIMLTYWFTKAQAKTMVSLLSDEVVNSALTAYDNSLKNNKTVITEDDSDSDAYYEAESSDTEAYTEAE